jgi:hypothetical protein
MDGYPSDRLISKFPALLCFFFVMASVGFFVEAVRFHVYSYLTIHWSLDRLPGLSRLLVMLPSEELYSRFKVYILIYLLPWLIVVLRLNNMTTKEVWRASSIGGALAIVTGGWASYFMISPCFARVTLLQPDDLPSSPSANFIVMLFVGLLLVAICKLLFFPPWRRTKPPVS